jgi:hypothetical protein
LQRFFSLFWARLLLGYEAEDETVPKQMHGIAKALAGLALGAAALSAPFPLYTAAAHYAAIQRADFRGHTFSAEVHHIADWAVNSGDHKNLAFIVVDKRNAKAIAFDRHGKFLQATPVLIGIGVGDTFPPGVAELEMNQTQPWQRITPAGRFFAEEGVNLQGQSVLWVDYDAAIAIHRLPSKETKERRRERIVAADPAQHRITFGCINVAPDFYDRVVRPNFGTNGGMVYVLPDSTPLKTVFKSSYEVGERRLSSAEQTRASPSPVQRF